MGELEGDPAWVLQESAVQQDPVPYAAGAETYLSAGLQPGKHQGTFYYRAISVQGRPVIATVEACVCQVELAAKTGTGAADLPGTRDPGSAEIAYRGLVEVQRNRTLVAYHRACQRKIGIQSRANEPQLPLGDEAAHTEHSAADRQPAGIECYSRRSRQPRSGQHEASSNLGVAHPDPAVG